MDRMSSPTRASAGLRNAALVGGLFFIAAATLVPSFGNRRPTVGSACVLCGEFGTPDLVLNILLFIPFGIAMGMRRIPAIRALGIALALSAVIESIQLVLPGRSSTLRDVLTNAIGGGLGALIALRLAGWLEPGRRALVLHWLFTILAVGSVGLTGALLRPALSEGPYFAHWVPDHDYLANWTGELDSVYIDGRSVPPGRIRDTGPLRAAIASGADIRIKGRSGAPTRRLNGIFTIADAEEREILLVGGIGDDLVVRSRRLAAMFRLHYPHAQFGDLLGSGAVGTPFELVVRGDLVDGSCAKVDGNRDCSLPPPAGSVWSLFLPMQTTPPVQQRLFDLLTFFCLTFPVALWSRSVPTSQARAGLLVLLAGLIAAPWYTHLAVPGIPEWVGLVLAVMAGPWLHRRLVSARAAPSSGRGSLGP